MNHYIDTSVLVPIFLPEETSDSVTQWLDGVGDACQISGLAAAEFGSAISRTVRMGQLTSETGMAVLKRFDEWVASYGPLVDNIPRDIDHAALLVRRPQPKLQTPDAIHIASCARLGLTMVTLDNVMADIAGSLGLAVVIPS